MSTAETVLTVVRVNICMRVYSLCLSGPEEYCISFQAPCSMLTNRFPCTFQGQVAANSNDQPIKLKHFTRQVDEHDKS